MSHPEVFESEECFVIQTRVGMGTRVFIGLLGLVPLIAPYDFLVKVRWNSYFNFPFLLVLIVSIGSVFMSAMFVYMGTFATSIKITLDRRTQVFCHSSEALTIRNKTEEHPLSHIQRLEVRETNWSDGPPSYNLQFVLEGDKVYEVGPFNSLAEVDQTRDRVNRFLKGVNKPSKK
jgi:hypothetical protein